MGSSTADMRLSGGHPVLDFINTVDSRRDRWGPDFMTSFDQLIVLAERVGLVGKEEAASVRSCPEAEKQSALEDAHELREAFYRIFLTEDSHDEIDTSDLALIDAAAREARSRQKLSSKHGIVAWSNPVRSPADLIDAITLSGTDLLVGRAGRRDIRECKGHNCGWLFLDRSKGGHRIWCSDASCGTRSRVKRYRSS
jgi:predicted RNA-binding Zn ribbon-like protein